MPTLTANGIEIHYETFGDARQPPIVLVMGLGGQLILWPEDFCQALADAGFHVVRYDNRDVGLSSRLHAAGRPRLLRAALAAGLGLPVRAPYRLDDMAADAIGLMDALGLADAHVVGVSMGGMIAQILASKYADRVRSLTSIMSASGSRRVPGPRFDLRLRLVRRPPLRDRESLIRYSMETWRLIGSPGYPADDETLYAKVARSIDRATYPVGLARQTLAILASGSRVPLLRRIKAPTLIVHGAEDPLVPVAAAHDLARHIPHARLHIIPRMGHDLPAALLPKLAEMITQHAAAADRAATPVQRRAAAG